MFERFTTAARTAVFDARAKATARGEDHIGPLHLLSALTTGDSVATRALAEQGVDAAAIEQELGPAPADDTVDATALQAIGIDLDEIRQRVEESFGEGALERVRNGPHGALGRMGRMGRSPLTDDAKQALAESLKEARSLHHNYIGTEHLLLGLLRAADRRQRGGFRLALGHLGLDYPTTRQYVIDHLARDSA
jgi:ATP-dependent Clp protease ATP-binding subunit ClpA